MRKSKSFSLFDRGRSFAYALKGIVGFFRAEHNSILHLAATALVIILALFFKITSIEAIALTLSVSSVWCAELFNTAIERIGDLISLEYNKDIGFIKDVAAGAVLVTSLAALITGCIVFIPKFIV